MLIQRMNINVTNVIPLNTGKRNVKERHKVTVTRYGAKIFKENSQPTTLGE
ncbi:hypothetical protein LEP1GSC175_3086 [Leptospira santarosai str. HAI821]|nr:hypothetical protein LEP1GSC175_3086 [Leptospira santarosai str. HAI821]